MSTHYINKNAFLKELSKRLKGVDVSKSGRMAKYGFAMKEGESFNCPSVATMIKAINKIQEDLLLPNVAKVAGSGFIVSWTEKEITEVVEKVVEIKTDIKVTSDKPKKTKKPKKEAPTSKEK